MLFDTLYRATLIKLTLSNYLFSASSTESDSLTLIQSMPFVGVSPNHPILHIKLNLSNLLYLLHVNSSQHIQSDNSTLTPPQPSIGLHLGLLLPLIGILPCSSFSHVIMPHVTYHVTTWTHHHATCHLPCHHLDTSSCHMSPTISPP